MGLDQKQASSTEPLWGFVLILLPGTVNFDCELGRLWDRLQYFLGSVGMFLGRINGAAKTHPGYVHRCTAGQGPRLDKKDKAK